MPAPCILTGAEGENPDDCTTHDHEDWNADGCTKCGSEHHTRDECPEYTSVADYEADAHLDAVVTSDSDRWEEDPAFPFSDWQYEVANLDTRLGYADWLAHKHEERT